MNAMRLLGSLMGGRRSGGGLLGSLLGSVGGGMLGRSVGGRGGGMVGGLLGSMLGGRMGAGAGRGGGGLLGSVLGGGVGGTTTEYHEIDDTDVQADAEILVRGMLNAAKADGEVSRDEIEAIVAQMDDLDTDDERWLRDEIARPLDQGYAASVPAHLALEAYAVSLMAITLDTGAEAAYLNHLAAGLGLDRGDLDRLHDELGAPRLPA